MCRKSAHPRPLPGLVLSSSLLQWQGVESERLRNVYLKRKDSELKQSYCESGRPSHKLAKELIYAVRNYVVRYISGWGLQP